MPALKKRLHRDRLDLLSEPVHVDIHHRVVGLVSRTAKRVLDEDDAEAPVDCAEHGAQNADVSLAAGYDDRIYVGAAQLLVQVAAGPWRIDMLIEDFGGRNKRRKVWDEANHVGADLIDGHRRPALIVLPPHADAMP